MYGEGGTKSVALLVAIPNGVATFNRPDRPAAGTVIPRLDVTADVTVAGEVFTVTVLLAVVVWKFVPFIVTGVPAAAMAGEKLVIVGADGGLPTVNAAPLADPPGLVTASPPVVAPVGTTAVNCVDVADVAVAVTCQLLDAADGDSERRDGVHRWHSASNAEEGGWRTVD